MRKKITALKNWLAAHKREAVFLSLAVLISTASFAAGYLLARESNEAPIIISSSAPSAVSD